MALYIKDPNLTADRLASFREQQAWAEYEAKAAVIVARQLGMTWKDIGEALGVTKQGAEQWYRRGMAVLTLDEAEIQRIAKLLGAGDKVTRYEVRTITSGVPGVSRVVRATHSQHLRCSVAAKRAKLREGGEVWAVEPSGHATKLTSQKVAAIVRIEQADHTHDDDDEMPF